MIVDDSVSIRQLVKLTLTKEGYNVLEAIDGKDALDKLNNATVHMLITDLTMPKMDGIALTEEVRSKPEYKFIPIIILTTASQIEKKQEVKAAGATGWIVKPFSPEELIDIINKLLG
jgi:two-component system chemotaxis response regulator CheY